MFCYRKRIAILPQNKVDQSEFQNFEKLIQQTNGNKSISRENKSKLIELFIHNI
jgi:hypothetical protein